jgi:hypothetical protein
MCEGNHAIAGIGTNSEGMSKFTRCQLPVGREETHAETRSSCNAQLLSLLLARSHICADPKTVTSPGIGKWNGSSWSKESEYADTFTLRELRNEEVLESTRRRFWKR